MKFLRILKSIFVWLVAILAVVMMVFTVVSVATFDRTDRSLFGYRAFIVLSDSMSRTDFSAGDHVLVSPCDPAELKEMPENAKLMKLIRARLETLLAA